MTTLEQNLTYIYHTSWYLVGEIYRYILSWCNYQPDPEDFWSVGEYLQACADGDEKSAEKILKKHDDYDRNEGLVRACAHGHKNLAQLLLNNGADDLDRGLKVACKNNRFSTAELMAEKGAKISVGLRYSTSPNITRMLYRIENGGGNIN